jgi:serine/threonine-protein kinase
MYSSPEQTRRKSKLDGRSDIWGVGVIMYQLFSLLVDVPFDPVELLLNRQVVPPLSLHARTTPLSPSMEALVMRALEVDPARRWQSAEEMGDALHAEEARILETPHPIPNQNTNAANSSRRNDPVRAQTDAAATVSAAGAVAAAASSPVTAAVSPAVEVVSLTPTPTSPASSSSDAAPSSSASSSLSSPARQSASDAAIAAASADSEPVHPRYRRRGMMAFSSGEPAPPPPLPSSQPPLVSKL